MLLNVEQQQVTTELQRNILLLAPAGTGKTNAIAHRIVHILQEQAAQPSEILCLTFTNRACKEMRERIASVVGKAATEITVRTFHGFCYTLLKDEGRFHSDLSVESLVFDEEDCKEIVSTLLREMGNGSQSESFHMQSVMNLVERVKNRRILEPDKSYKELIRDMELCERSKLIALCLDARYRYDDQLLNFFLHFGHQLLRRYDQILSERRGLDFNDLLIRTFELFQLKEVTRRWQKKFKFIHIDEFQDTSSVEYQLISRIFGDNRIMVCGDWFQTIYEWRGSCPDKVIALYEAQYQPVRIVLAQSYRSTQNLLHAADGFLRNSFGLQRVVEWHSKGTRSESLYIGERILVKSARNAEREAVWIFETIRRLGLKDLSKIAILSRTNRINQMLSEVFSQINASLPTDQRIGFLLVDAFRFFRRQEVKDLLAFLKLAINPYDEISWERILLRFAKGIGEAGIASLQKPEIRSQGLRLADFFDTQCLMYGDPYHGLIQSMTAGRVVIFDVESTGLDTARDEVIQIAALRIDPDGRECERFVRFLKPVSRVGSSESVHGYSDQFLSVHGQDPETVLSEFAHFAEGAFLVGHNVGFDKAIITSQMRRIHLPELHITGWGDTLEMSHRYLPELTNHKLASICHHFKVKAVPSHDALADILATQEILLRFFKDYIQPGAMQRFQTMSRSISRYIPATSWIRSFRDEAMSYRPSELLKILLEMPEIKAVYYKEPVRWENMNELQRLAEAMDDLSMSCRDAMSEFLKYTSLSNSELDRLLNVMPRVPIVTVHQAKGAEFDVVFIAGLQENQFPMYQAIRNNDLDEETRAFYVAMTRAKKRLYLSWAEMDERGRKQPSRFIRLIPQECLQLISSSD